MDVITELAQRLSALKETSNPAEAAKLLQWIRDGGLESLKPTLMAFLQLFVEPTYHILALPLLATVRLTKEQQAEVKQYAQTHGYRIFAPENVASTGLDGPELCTFLYAAFKQLLLAEHRVGLSLYERTSGYKPPSGFSLTTLSESDNPLVQTITTQINTCISSEVLDDKAFIDTLWDLINDIYDERDNGHVFGGGTSRGINLGMDVSEIEEKRATEPSPDEPASEPKHVRRPLIRPKETYVVPNYKNNTALILLHPTTYAYLGHIYVWPSIDYTDTADIIGVRTSLVNLVNQFNTRVNPDQINESCSSVEKVGYKLIAAAVIWAHRNKFQLARIRQPLDVVAHIARRLGFWKSRFDDYWILVEPNTNRISEIAYPEGYDLFNYGCTYPWFEPGADLSPDELKSLTEQFIREKSKYRYPTPEEITQVESRTKVRNKWLPYYYWVPTSLGLSGFYESPDEIVRILEREEKKSRKPR